MKKHLNPDEDQSHLNFENPPQHALEVHPPVPAIVLEGIVVQHQE